MINNKTTINHPRLGRGESVSSIATIYYLKCLVSNTKLQDIQRNRKGENQAAETVKGMKEIFKEQKGREKSQSRIFYSQQNYLSK